MSTHTQARSRSIWDPQIVRRAIRDSLVKLHPRTMARNPVMFVVEVGSVLTTWRLIQDAITGSGNLGFELQITFWLWLTVLFANFAEAMAEGRGKAQADTLRKAKSETVGHRERADGSLESVPAPMLRKGDIVRVSAGELIPADGEIYRPEKVEQALTNFFRKGNLSTLRELALRAVADKVGQKAASYRVREGLEPALIPERVMVCMSSNALAPRVIRTGARIAGRLGARWYAVYVETPLEQPGRIKRDDADALQDNIQLAESLGATVVRVKAERAADGLIAFAQREGVTHVIFGQSARTRWELLWRGSTLDRFLGAVPDAAVQVVPLNEG